MVIIALVTCNAPNIIYILADDLGWFDVGFHGSKQVKTPNIDTLAYDGIILNNYYVQPICTPSRSALMTGKHPIHTGMQHEVIFGSQPYGLGLENKLMPQYLKEIGYMTHMIGKWHLGFFDPLYTPMKRGFDTHFGYYLGCGDYYDHTYSTHALYGKNGWGLDFWNNTTAAKTFYGEYSTEVFTRQAENIIIQHNTSKPLFLYLAHQAVHSGNPITPLEAPWKYLKYFGHVNDVKRHTFLAMLYALDISIGKVVKALGAKNMLENTIIIFSTDNGGPPNGFNMNSACNWPLRGGKTTLFEGGIRGAGFIWSPLLKKYGYVSNHMMQIFDWLPTILSVSGYNSSLIPKDIDGIDMWNTLSYNRMKSPRSSMLHNIDDKKSSFALRVRNMKLIFGKINGPTDWYPEPTNIPDKSQTNLMKNNLSTENNIPLSDASITLSQVGREPKTGQPVFIECGVRPVNASKNCKFKEKPCLFDISKDPCEYNNIANIFPNVVELLLRQLNEFNSSAVAPRNKPLDPKGLPGLHNGVWKPWVNVQYN